VRFSSLQIRRIASLEKMPWKMLESMTVDGMSVFRLNVQMASAARSARIAAAS
jgi:hypothetical protein